MCAWTQRREFSFAGQCVVPKKHLATVSDEVVHVIDVPHHAILHLTFLESAIGTALS